MFIPAMPLVKEEFQIGDNLAFATLSLTMMTMAVTSIIYGGISDEWGRKLFFNAGPLSSIFCGLETMRGGAR